jgi:glycine cleavage system H lipoate-binding protein/ABC-type phosphate transport system substrate-binding protein
MLNLSTYKAMKTKVLILVGLLTIFIGNIASVTANDEKTNQGKITLYSSPDVFPLSQNWANAFQNGNLAIKNWADDKATPDLSYGALWLTTTNPEMEKPSALFWKISIGQDAIVAIMNDKNPLYQELYKTGVSVPELFQLLTQSESSSWGEILKTKSPAAIHFYIANRPHEVRLMADFLKADLTQFKGKKVETEDELISTVQNDPSAIAFCRLSAITDIAKQQIKANIAILPIDKNGNGELDYAEKIYENYQTFVRGVWIGKYPKALSQNIYLVSKRTPAAGVARNFTIWALSKGQNMIGNLGFVELANYDRQAKIEMFSDKEPIAQSASTGNILWVALALILGLFVLFFGINSIYNYIKREKKIAVPDISTQPQIFKADTVDVLKGLYYDKTHTWAFMQQSGNLKVGIDDFMQNITGTLSRLKMKEIGEKVRKGEILVTIVQNGKQLNIYAPVSGVITAKNNLLSENAEFVNKAPFNEGWIYEIEPEDWAREMPFLLIADKYKEWLKVEFIRLRDMLASVIRINEVNMAQLVLQDGGELQSGVLSVFGPEVWDDFQTYFIDASK